MLRITAVHVTVMNDLPNKTRIRRVFIAHASEENNHCTLIKDASGKGIIKAYIRRSLIGDVGRSAKARPSPEIKLGSMFP